MNHDDKLIRELVEKYDVEISHRWSEVFRAVVTRVVKRKDGHVHQNDRVIEDDVPAYVKADLLKMMCEKVDEVARNYRAAVAQEGGEDK